jgi:GT2 family glycosyltransferase
MQAFPDVGMINGLPARHLTNWATKSTLARAHSDPAINVEAGKLIDEKTLLSICEGTGRSFDDYMQEHQNVDDFRLTCGGVRAFVGAHHFQFLARKSVLQRVGQLDTSTALGTSELQFDEALDEAGYLRLSTESQYVFHLGNMLTPTWKQVAREYSVAVPVARSNGSITRAEKLRQRVRQNPLVRRVLLRLYGGIFNLYYYGDGKPPVRE